MIVWSRGLGKQRLPLDLAGAALSAEANHLVLRGVIEPVCWDYAIRLTPADLRDFLRLLAQPNAARFMAQRPGVLGPFVVGLIAVAPRLVIGFLVKRLGMGSKGAADDALLV